MKSFVIWLDVPLESVTHTTVSRYIDYLMRKRLEPKTVNCHVNSISQFYHYLREEENWTITNPIRKNHILKMSRPLPRHLRDEQVETFFKVVKGHRDRAMFMLMLRCGLRVEEVANVSLGVIDFKHRKILIEDGKGSKDRIVYMSNDVIHALAAYLRVRPHPKPKRFFWWKKGLNRTAHLYPRHSKAHGILCPQSESSACPVIISGIRWPLSCSMQMLIFAPSRIFWGIVMSKPHNGIAGYQISKYRGITSMRWR